MKIKDKKDALNIFLQSATLYSELEGGENHKLLNKQFKKICGSAGFLKRTGDLKALTEFIDNENPGVCAWAAYFLLAVDEEKAKKKLKDIEKAKIPHISLSAEYTLKEWESGTLNIYFGE